MDRYDGSAELCARLVKRYASEPVIQLVELFRLVVFAWWTGNGDMHLKNLSLLTGRDGRHRLSPAYDLLCSRLVIDDDRLALPVGGRDARIGRAGWLEYADDCGLRPRPAERVLGEIASARDDALALIDRSALPPDMKADYRDLVRERSAVLAR